MENMYKVTWDIFWIRNSILLSNLANQYVHEQYEMIDEHSTPSIVVPINHFDEIFDRGGHQLLHENDSRPMYLRRDLLQKSMLP
jgi:hypothetical protein